MTDQDLVARLRAIPIDSQGSADHSIDEAVDRIEALSAENSRLSAALEVAENAIALANKACGDLAERVAEDCDHHGLKHPTWYNAVKKFRAALAKIAEATK